MTLRISILSLLVLLALATPAHAQWRTSAEPAPLDLSSYPRADLRIDSGEKKHRFDVWIADTPEEFVELAVKLASDLPRLADIRANLRKRMTESAFFDFKARTRGLEAGYYEMVRRYNEERA